MQKLPRMTLLQIKNPFGRDTILTQDTWDEILFKHPEMIGHLDEVQETICCPEFIKESISDARVLLYYRFYPNILKGKHLTVVVKSVDFDFVSTAYFARRIAKGGSIVWTQP